MANEAKIKVVCTRCKTQRDPSLEDTAPCPQCGCPDNALLLNIPDIPKDNDEPLEPVTVPEFKDKSVIVYYPSFVIDNPRLLTSLCLYNDKVLLFIRNQPEITLGSLRTKTKDDPAFADELLKFESFMKKPLPVLSDAGLLDVVTNEECNKRFERAGELPIDKHLLKEMITSQDSSAPRIKSRTTIGELIRSLDAYSVAKRYELPLAGSFGFPFDLMSGTAKGEVEATANVLAHSTICQLALPDIVAIDPEDILLIKEKLNEELIEFRVGILELTWLLRQSVTNKQALDEIRHEAEIIIHSKVTSALTSLEQRIKRHEKGRIRKMLFSSGRVIINSVKLFLPGGVSEMLLGASKSLFQLAVEVDSQKPPSDQVASFIYQLRKTTIDK